MIQIFIFIFLKMNLNNILVYEPRLKELLEWLKNKSIFKKDEFYEEKSISLSYLLNKLLNEKFENRIVSINELSQTKFYKRYLRSYKKLNIDIFEKDIQFIQKHVNLNVINNDISCDLKIYETIQIEDLLKEF